MVAHATGLLLATARQWRHQAGGTERRPTTTVCNLRDDSQLPVRSPRASRVRWPGGSSTHASIQGEHLARGPCSPSVFPLDGLVLAATMVVVVPVIDVDQWRANGGCGGPSGTDRRAVDRGVCPRSTRDLQSCRLAMSASTCSSRQPAPSLGELVYQLKYRNGPLNDIVDTAVAFVTEATSMCAERSS